MSPLRSVVNRSSMLCLAILLIAAWGSPAWAALLRVGDVAPDFTLPDQNGTRHSLRDYRGRTVVLAFYPKDFTPG